MTEKILRPSFDERAGSLFLGEREAAEGRYTWPRRTAALIASQAGNGRRRRLGTIPISASASLAMALVAEPSSREHVRANPLAKS